MTFISVTELQAVNPIQIISQQQEQDTEAPTLIGTESLFFADIDTVNRLVYVMIYDEFWSYDLREEEWEKLHVFDEGELDELLSEPKEFGYDHVSDHIYLWSTGVGLVYRIDLETFEIQRIDQSFPHKNQFGHIPFFREGKIHAFGGYGFWEDKNLITHFNPEVREWLLVSPAEGSPYPPERVNGFGTYVDDQDALYVYSGSVISNREHDGINAIRTTSEEVWKFDFTTMSWSLVMTPGALPGPRFPSVGIRNVYGTGKTTISVAPYSNASGLWYIPLKEEGGDMANVYLKPFDLVDHIEYEPVQIDATIENAMIGTHFLYDPKSEEIIFVGYRNVTNDEEHPLMVLKVPESKVIEELVPVETNRVLVYGSLIVVGFLLIIGWVYFRRMNLISTVNGSHPTIKHDEFEAALNSVERSLLKALMKSDHMPETSELEEMVWPEVDNYDYRRKLRNETIRSINEKAVEQFGLKEDLIIRQRDLEDNRRFRYGVNRELIN